MRRRRYNKTATSAPLFLDIQEIRDALSKHVDVLACHACLMSMLEVAYEVHDRVDVMVASEVLVKEDGLPWEDILSKLEKGGSLFNAHDLGKLIVHEFETANKTRAQVEPERWHEHGTLTALRVNELMPLLANAFDALAGELLRGVSTNFEALRAARRDVMVQLYNPDYVDLYSFLDAVRHLVRRPELISAVRTLLDEKQVLSAFGLEDEDKCGLSIYFPDNKSEEASLGDYANLRINKDYDNWVRFLRLYLAAISDEKPVSKTA